MFKPLSQFRVGRWLPVWLSGYRYKKRHFPLAVNGQSGAVAGDVPRGGFQRLLAGLFGED